MTIKQAIVLCLLALAAGASLATERETFKPQHQHQSATASAGSAYSGVSGDNSMWVLPGFGQGSFAGQYSICIRLRIYAWQGYVTQDPDMECIELIARLDRLKATPVPVVAPQIMTQPACSEPPKAKPAKPKAAATECRR